MKNVVSRGVIGWVVIFLFAGTSSVLAEEISIVGTGSGTAILQAIGEAFHQRHPQVTISVPESIGSGGGIKAVGRNEYVLGRVARQIKENEKPYGLTLAPIAKTPIVFFVNTSVSVRNLSVQQVLDIYSGTITNWKDVGGDDARIRVITREEGDSSRGVLEESFPGFKEMTVTSRSKMTFSDPETEATVEDNAGAIAYGSYTNARNINANILTIEGKSAADADYPYVGMLALIFKEKNYTGNVKLFMEFATSAAAHDAIKDAGGIPF
jgi:phosphate transport system substrate-binding protein